MLYLLKENMIEEANKSDLQSNPIRDYLVVAFRYWWLIAAVFTTFVILSILYASRPSDYYEARARLLIVPRFSERIGASGVDLSGETLSRLATASDLLDQVINELDLKNPTTGSPWSVESLSARMDPQVETAGRSASPTTLPILSMTVTGDDPKQASEIANKWADVFIRKNAELFITEAGHTYNLLTAQLDENKKKLTDVEGRRLAYLDANRLATLESDLKVTSSKYEEFSSQIHNKRAFLVETQATLQNAEAAFAKEPQFLEIKRAISNEAIWTLLGISPTERTARAIPDLVVDEQIENESYFRLKERIITLRLTEASLKAEIVSLENRTQEFRKTIEDLSGRITQIKFTLDSFESDRKNLLANNQVLIQSLNTTQLSRAEQTGSIRLVESAVTPSSPVGPNRIKIVQMGMVLGLLFGLGSAFLVHILRTPQRSV